MEELITAFTVISFASFIGIVWWAWRPGSKEKGQLAVGDLLADNDHDPHVPSAARGVQK